MQLTTQLLLLYPTGLYVVRLPLVFSH